MKRGQVKGGGQELIDTQKSKSGELSCLCCPLPLLVSGHTNASPLLFSPVPPKRGRAKTKQNKGRGEENFPLARGGLAGRRPSLISTLNLSRPPCTRMGCPALLVPTHTDHDTWTTSDGEPYRHNRMNMVCVSCCPTFYGLDLHNGTCVALLANVQ